MAVSVNSPTLFKHQLWQETRIPLFEQSINTAKGSKRVTFGCGFAQQSIAECFQENLENYPVLLPVLFKQPSDQFQHLRFHNGVIWRWNRPLIGFDEDDTPHIRIEHRVMPAGPTIQDMIANAVFFYGLAQILATETAIQRISFQQAKDNFYQTAQYGLNGKITWLDGKTYLAQDLIVQQLLDLAQKGLKQLNIDSDEIEHYLNIIAERTLSGQTGAQWQCQQLKQNGGDYQNLVKTYLHHQHSANPVHTWTLG